MKIEQIEAAYARIAGRIVETPVLRSPFLDEIAGRRVHVKAECLQGTGSFKLRGATSALTALDAETRARGVLAYSSGNHAQGVALAAQRLGVPAVIIMPDDAPALKIANTRALGAEVVLYDRVGGQSREALGRQLSEARGLTLVKPYDDRQVIAGQGTVGLELARQLPDGLEADVLVCCGGGGLTSGIALALEAHRPQLRVRPVEPDGFDDVTRSLRSGTREENAALSGSICDAIVTPSPGELTFPIMHRLCGAGLTVSDSEALRAVAQAALRLKLVAEPGGAVALAAALWRCDEIEGDDVVVVITGGNADPATLTRALATLEE
ncbi:threonine ammonia-lyase [Palleronia caenipelagi]|uniref:Threonine/serine dehydratase n=1 Tax=Palleronia caenipelagi TaxID=2489174 RepID=A0A547QAV1_9RHOB|nr:threonine/serine dehydratase [Palleronia caenipelagi]TRD23521.1 threonine/serine dehydratase [Palleronia caenipelagi]